RSSSCCRGSASAPSSSTSRSEAISRRASPSASATERGSPSRRARSRPRPRRAPAGVLPPRGGTFYAREAPHLPLLIEEGQHFEAGQPLFIIEVMKMFNKVLAPFAGTVTKGLMADRDGQLGKKGE